MWKALTRDTLCWGEFLVQYEGFVGPGGSAAWSAWDRASQKQLGFFASEAEAKRACRKSHTERAILERGYAEGVESMESDIREMKRCEPWRTR